MASEVGIRLPGKQQHLRRARVGELKSVWHHTNQSERSFIERDRTPDCRTITTQIRSPKLSRCYRNVQGIAFIKGPPQHRSYTEEIEQAPLGDDSRYLLRISTSLKIPGGV